MINETIKEFESLELIDQKNNVTIFKNENGKIYIPSLPDNLVKSNKKYLKKKEMISEQLQEKREALHQEKMIQRRIRKSVKNKALTVAKSKYDRRRIAKGATAEQLSTKKLNVSSSRPRTTKREAARNMEKLSRKFSDRRIESTSTEETTEKILVTD